MIVQAGSTDVTTYFHLRLAADGTDATGLPITNIDLQYVRSGVAPAAKVDATALAATDSAHGDNQAIEVDATDQPGVYRVDWPDAAFASGVREVILTVKCATALTESLRVELSPSVNVAAFGGTAGTFSSGRPEVNTTHAAGTAWGSGAITAASIANDAITDAKVASDVTIASVTGAVGSVTGNVGGNVAGSVGSVTGAVGSVTGNVGGNVTGSVGSVTGNVGGSIGSLAAQAKADVNAEVVDALATDTYAEPGQGAPSATTSLAAKVNYLFKWARNKKTQSTTETKFYDDAGTTVDHKIAVSDDGSTLTVGEIASGP